MKILQTILIGLILISQIFSEDIEIIVTSDSFTIDTVNPEITLYSPSHGDEFNAGDLISVIWEASDQSPGSNPMTLNVSANLDDAFMELFSGFPNTGSLELDVPDFINTMFASVRLDIVDFYGNMSSAYSSGYFTLGNPDESIYEVVDEVINMQITSNVFEIDTNAPEVNWEFPNQATSFESSQGQVVRWVASDETLIASPISLFFVDSGVDVYPLAENIDNNGITFINLPNIETSLGHFKVVAIDSYGNIGYDLSDEYMSVGTDATTELVEETTTIEINSDPFTMDTKLPLFNMINENDYFYPNGGEIITDYSSINLDWNCYDESFDNGLVEVSLAYLLGGWYVVLDSFPHSSFYAAPTDLSLNGLVDNTIWARLIFTAIDDFGNRNTQYNDDYFVLGSSDGDIDIELTDEDELEMMLSWTWNTSQHTVKILNRAINFLEEGDQIFIVDENGISSTDCEGADGYIELASESCETNPSGNLRVAPIKSHIGINHCSAGGGKLTGYNEQDTVRFKIVSGTESYFLRPSSYRGSLVFDNTVTVIEEFNIEPYDLESQSNSPEITLWDERDADNFNVYSRVTNHQTNFRNCDNDGVCDSSELLDNYTNQEDCENNSGTWDASFCYYDYNGDGVYSPDEVDENIGDCYADCCSDQGSGENQDWCFVEEVTEEVYTHSLVQQNYVANEQSSATINYRVWVLDDDGNEMFKTVETDGVDINIDASEIGTYERTLFSGWNWFSLNVHEGNGDMTLNNLFANSTPSNNDYIKSQTQASTYYTAGNVWYPELTLDVLSLYMVNMNSENLLTYSGIYAGSTDTLFIGSGWNWIGYVPQNSGSINTALASITPSNGDYIKSQTQASTYYTAGNVWYPDITMNPTEGYMLNSTTVDTLIYPDISRMPEEEDQFVDYVWDVNYTEYEFNASAIFELDMEHLEVSENDQLAVFSNNICIGVAKADICPLNDKILFPLMYYSNLESENDLTLKYYNVLSETEIAILETLDFEKDTYQGNAYEPIILHDANIPTAYNLEDPYPNPFNPTTQIHFSLLDNVDNIDLNIYDIRGRLVKSLLSGYMEKGYHSIEWNASNLASGIYFIHMHANNNTFIKKVTLLK